MKKNVFALGVAAALAGFAGTASAQYVGGVPSVSNELATGRTDAPATQFVVNDGGIGHILLAPYFTVQGERNTLLNIINTDTANGKAVKVRFRGARNSDDLFDFYVFLSPGDNWRARVYPEGEDVKVDVSVDTSCTLPERAAFGDGAFSTVRVYEGLAEELREGYIELLTVADIPAGATLAESSDLYRTIKHNANTGVVECDTDLIAESLSPLLSNDEVGLEDAQSRGLDFPTTGLVGHWAITHVPTNSTVSGNVTAVEARTDENVAGFGNIVVAPQSWADAPDSWRTEGTADPLFAAEVLDPLYFDFPDLSTPYLGSITPADQANHLSGGLAVSRIINEYTTRAANFRTDWLFSLPTRRYGVAIDYTATGNTRLVTNPANNYFRGTVGVNAVAGTGGGNVVLRTLDGAPTLAIPVGTRFYDLDERTARAGVDFSPQRPSDGFELNGEVVVLSFNANGSNSVLGAALTNTTVSPTLTGGTGIDSGWGYVDLPNTLTSVGDVPAVSGLPVIGFAALTAGGQNLGFTWPHRYNKAQ